MTRRTATAAIVGALAMWLVTPAIAAEPGAEPGEGSPATATEDPAVAPRYASVEIDTSDIGEEGPVIKRRIRERTDVALRAAGVLPGRSDSDDPVIFVDVDELVGADPGYQCEVWIARNDVVLGERRRVECTLCTESEIVQRVETTVTELVAQLDTLVEPEPEPAVEPAVEPEPAPEPVDSTPTDDDRRTRLGALGKAGAAFIAVGVAGVGVGVVLVALPPRVNEENPLYETSYRPPGTATLAAGAAVLVVGVVMLVVDRRRARASRTALVPALGPTGAGVVWSGRF